MDKIRRVSLQREGRFPTEEEVEDEIRKVDGKIGEYIRDPKPQNIKIYGVYSNMALQLNGDKDRVFRADNLTDEDLEKTRLNGNYYLPV